MTEIGAPKHEPLHIGEEAKPPFAVLPNPQKMFLIRAVRLEALSAGHEIESYLRFVARLAQAQHGMQAVLPDTAPLSEEQLALAAVHAMPPLSRSDFDAQSDPAFGATLKALLGQIDGCDWPAASRAASHMLAGLSEAELSEFVTAVLGGSVRDDQIAEYVLLSAALQVHFARRAAKLVAEDLKPVADGVCPACGSPPVSSAVVGWPAAHNTRFCTCSLCATQWHVVRVKCVLCSSTEGISYHVVEGKSDTVKAETCDACKSYVKILYQVKDPALEAFADDIATLGLDMLLSETEWKRGGVNPFLAGY